MRRSLKAVRARVERLAAAAGQPSDEEIDQELVALLQSARNRKPVERVAMTAEEMRAEGRELRARLKAAGLL
jgi:hypothetical protein